MTSVHMIYQLALVVMFAAGVGQGTRTFHWQDQSHFEMSWMFARKHCLQKRQSLPVVKDNATNAAFKLREKSSAPFTEPVRGTWLGASDVQVKGVFRWTDNTLLNWTNWAESQPDWDTNASMCIYAESNDLWISYPCTGVMKPFACQSPAASGVCNMTGCDMDSDKDVEEWTDHCYAAIVEPLTWGNASVVCQQTHLGRLMTLKTPSEASRVSLPDSEPRFWIGLSSTHTNGVFRWEDGTPLKNDSNWLHGAPTGGSAKQCVYMVAENNRELYSNDDCDIPLPAICEFQGGSNGTAVCDAQPIVANATLTNVMSESTTAVLHPGAKAMFACDLGHYFGQHVANWTIECMTCGQWSSIPPGCTAVDCQTPPAVPLATANYESTTFGAEVTYMCDVGYRFHGTNGSVDIHRMHCNATGNWTTKSNGRCVVVDCRAPPTVRNSAFYVQSTTFGSQATYTCATGYHFNDTDDIYEEHYLTCDAHGNWTGDSDLNCQLVDCGAPGRLENAIVSNGSTTFLQAAKYRREEGYRFGSTADPHHVIIFICDARGQWIGSNISCEERDDNSGSNGPSTTSTTDKAAATATVDPANETGGYTTDVIVPENLVSEAETKTVESTTVNNEPLKAKAHLSTRLCGPALPRAQWGNMLWKQDGRRVGHDAEFTCRAGSVFAEGGTSRSVLCMPDGKWHTQISVCEAILCPPVPYVVDATADKQDRTAGTVVTYTCQMDLLFADGINTANIQCTSSGQWYPDLSGCRERCPPLMYLDNAVSGPYSGVVGTSVTFRCKRGHRFRDGTTETSLRCDRNRRWEETEDCEVERCAALTPPDNGALNTTVATFGTIVEVTCDIGYKIRGNATRRTRVECLENRSWNASIPVCEEVDCGELPAVAHSTRSDEGTGYNAAVNITCDRDHRFEDGTQSKSILCTDTAVWSEVAMSCATDRCPPIPQLPGTVEIHPRANRLSKAVYSCLPGSVFPGGKRVYSMECNGTSWGRMPRTGCAVINCPRLYTLEKATVNSTERNYNNIVKITCDPGYTFKTGNSFTTRCNESAKWSGMPQKCERLNCGAPPVVHYSSILANVDTHYGSFVTVTCLLGYWVRPGVFSRDVTCTEEGVWEPPLSHCHVVTCTAWATWSGVVVDNSKQRRAGTVVNVSCAADKMFPDSEPYKMTTCGPRGGWLPAVPDCVYRTVPPRFVPKLKEATKSRLIGTLAIALVATLLVVMVALDVATLIYGHGDLKTKRRHDCRKPLRPLLGKTRLFWGRK